MLQWADLNCAEPELPEESRHQNTIREMASAMANKIG